MNDNKLIIPQYTLDQLAEDVCMKLDYFKTYYPSSKMWDGLMEHVTFIEQEPRNVNSVIVKVKENHSNALNSQMRNFHTILTRLYVLLYYRHRDDAVYQALVFPKLVKNMGIYGKDDMREQTDKTIDKILETDALVAKAKEEQQKERKPMFAFVSLNGNELDQLLDEYSEERLFCQMTNIIKDMNDKYNTRLDEVEVWYNAKRVVRSLCDVSHPEMFIERVSTALVHGQFRNEYAGSQIILLCVYAMVRAGKNRHFEPFIAKMETLANVFDTKLYVIKNSIDHIKRWLDTAKPFDGYDYLGKQPVPETFTKADIERIQQGFEQQLSEVKEKYRASLAKAQQENSHNLQMIDQLKDELEITKSKSDDDVSLAKDGKGFTVGQYACLLYAAALKIDGDNAVKDKLKDLFSQITGYNPSTFNKKLMGAFSEKDKDMVIKTIKDDMPNWAELVRKL